MAGCVARRCDVMQPSFWQGDALGARKFDRSKSLLKSFSIDIWRGDRITAVRRRTKVFCLADRA